MESIHKGAKWRFRAQAYTFLIFLFLFFVLPMWVSSSEIPFNFKVINYFWIFLIVYIILAEIFIHLSYLNWKYEFTKDSLKIEKGVIVKKYKSIPYERIQNVDITRGILARIIGFSTVDIQTAGYSAYGKGGAGLSEGHIPAVTIKRAEEIREFLVKKISGKKQGL